MNQPLLWVLCEALLMWFLGFPIWTRPPPCGPAVWFEDSWILGNEEVFIQNSTQRTGSWSIFSPPDSFFSGQEACRHWIFMSHPLNNLVWPALSSVLCPGQMLPVILEHSDELGRNPGSVADFGTHFLHLLCVFSLYKEYLVVQWDVAHLELMDSSETPLCGKAL